MRIIDNARTDDDLNEALHAIWEQTGPADHAPEIDKEQIFHNITAPDTVRPLRPERYSFIRWAAAALILLFVGVGLYKFSSRKKVNVPNSGNLAAQIKPGTDKALLTLADGTVIMLNDRDSSMALGADNAVIRIRKGQLTYKGMAGQHKQGGTAYHTLTTPRGGQYRIELPDGTNVWLNASSTLRFPEQFDSDTRMVKLEGEGYFEVAKNKAKPFIVAVNNTEVKVLGTHFNIMGYADEPSTNTTLIEGAVQITSGKNKVLLKPGDQARVSDGIQVAKVDTEPYVAWKNGDFNFEHERIESIMRKLSRWYNIEVKYQGKITNEGFVGKLPRSKNLADVLDILETTGLVHFKVEERSVTVMP